MNLARLRKEFAEFLGGERYQRFVWQINHPRDRLRLWQEEAWAKFVTNHPEFAMTPAELRVAFRVCEVHGDELQPYNAAVFHGCLDYSRDYERAWADLFPHSKRDVWSTEGMPFEGASIELWFCPSCCEAKKKWSRDG